MIHSMPSNTLNDYPTIQLAAPNTPLHLLGRFTQAFTGAERELLDIQRLIGNRRAVKLWSDMPLHPSYAGQGVTTIQPFAKQFPNGGTLLIAGVHLQPGIWLKYARFDRVVLLYNLANHGQLFASIEAVRNATGRDPELVFVSHMLQQSVGLPGTVIRSLMDITPFLAVAGKRFQSQPKLGALTIGRISRDSLDKHHPDDVALYRQLASRGFKVRIMGGTCLTPGLGQIAGVELLPAGVQGAADFYASLDIFFYRTGTSTEAYGRVVIEAMAAGLPVVAHARGGYAEVIEHNVSGVLFDSQEQAYDSLMRIGESADSRRKLGQHGLAVAVRLHGQAATCRDIDFYLNHRPLETFETPLHR